MSEILITLTDGEIEALSRDELREAVEAYELGEYSTHRDIFTFVLDNENVSNPAVMEAYANLLRTVKDVNFHDPVMVVSNYGTVIVKRWQGDDYLRASLKSTRGYRQARADKTTAESSS